jgi:murein DD-endopeptidase MepM/ murein hydrolase activator NlpD
LIVGRRPLNTIALLMGIVLLAPINVYAQDATVADLHKRLHAAREKVAAIQSAADTVEDKIASIDDEAGAVEDALAVSRALIEDINSEIAVLRLEIADQQETYKEVEAQARSIAIDLYKSGPSAQLAPLLSAKSLQEFSARLEYTGEVADSNIAVMVRAHRLKLGLDADKAVFETRLAQAQEARDEQLEDRQHLKDLRRAQTLELARLRQEISGAKKEADAIAARSAAIEKELAVSAAPAPTAVARVGGDVGTSGFAWPISGAITSGFGPRWGSTHTGIDIDCVTGAPIRASKAGSVLSASYDGGYGYHVVIDHGGGFGSLYAHASKLYVSSGESVSQGETIAACGSTGQSTGDHLHFEVRVNGAPQDPLRYLP